MAAGRKQAGFWRKVHSAVNGAKYTCYKEIRILTDYGEKASDVALKFIDAIREEDAAVFWDLLDMQGKGYFLGLWSYVLPDISLTTIISLAGESGFINDAMGSIIRDLKHNISGFLVSPRTGETLFDDDLHVRVAVRESAPVNDLEEGASEYVPLVMELVSASKAIEGVSTKTGANLTCWKIDTLKFLHFQSGLQQA